MLDSIHSATHEHLQLGEGVLIAGLDLEDALLAGDPAAVIAQAMQDPTRLIGATKAGCTFRCIPRLHDLTRGHRTPAEGETLTGPWQATLSGTLLEITPGNAAMLLNLPMPAATESSTLLTPEPSAFTAGLDSIGWVGSTGSGMLAIGLTAPVSTGGMILKAAPHGLGEMPFTLCARKRSPEDPALPCRLLWLKGGAACP